MVGPPPGRRMALGSRAIPHRRLHAGTERRHAADHQTKAEGTTGRERIAKLLWSCSVVAAVTCSTLVAAGNGQPEPILASAAVAVRPSNLAAASVFRAVPRPHVAVVPDIQPPVQATRRCATPEGRTAPRGAAASAVLLRPHRSRAPGRCARRGTTSFSLRRRTPWSSSRTKSSTSSNNSMVWTSRPRSAPEMSGDEKTARSRHGVRPRLAGAWLEK